MKDTLWILNNETGLVKDRPLGVGDANETPYVLISNGSVTAVATEDYLQKNGENVTAKLKPQTWEHTTLLETSGDDEDLSQLVNLLMLQCMDITARGVIPFELLPETLDGNIKTHDVGLDDAHGYWTRAVAILDTMDDEEEPRLVIKVMLSGVLFTGKFEEDGIELSEDNVGDTLMVIPRFGQPDDEDDKIDAVSFDVKLA
jgi:hypothetical protein